MKTYDKKLGMNVSISRRDVLHGFGAITAAATLPVGVLARSTPAYYPPAQTGMRGSHDGSFEVAHALAREGVTNWGVPQDTGDGVFDMVIVGAGLSGLAAAHFYRKEKPDARILILDNHDDFGGHAKRNEFEVDGKTMLAYGGSQTLQEPSYYPKPAKRLLRDLGIDLDRFYDAYDRQFFKRNGLRAGLHFDKRNWGRDHIAPIAFGMFDDYLDLAEPGQSYKKIVSEMPLSKKAQRQFLRLLREDMDPFADMGMRERYDYLQSISYHDFLAKHCGITEPDVFKLFEGLTIDMGADISKITAANGITYVGFPGWDIAGFPEDEEESEPYIHHFPDGNASVARMIVRNLVPDVAPGNSMEDIVQAKFDYSKLDQKGAPAIVRLSSTVIQAKEASAGIVDVDYVKDGKACRVQAKHCILACYNAFIPYLCPDLPESQKDAMAKQVKSPILYTTVAIRNWQAFNKLGIGGVYAPGGYHVHATLDFPVSMGGYKHGSSPDQPAIIHMEKFHFGDDPTLPPQDLFRAGRYELLTTPFETIEREVREQLNSMLGAGGFDAARDIAGITVNRWSHGYAMSDWGFMEKFYGGDDRKQWPNQIARKQFGRISIANSDAGAGAMAETAIREGYRAVKEQLKV